VCVCVCVLMQGKVQHIAYVGELVIGQFEFVGGRLQLTSCRLDVAVQHDNLMIQRVDLFSLLQ